MTIQKGIFTEKVEIEAAEKPESKYNKSSYIFCLTEKKNKLKSHQALKPLRVGFMPNQLNFVKSISSSDETPVNKYLSHNIVLNNWTILIKLV